MSDPSTPDKKPGIIQEPWLRGVAITTTVLAVLTAIVSARSSNCVAQTQLLTSEEGIRWTYYNSKSLKVQMLQVQRNLLSAQLSSITIPEEKKIIQDQIVAHDKDLMLNEGQQNIIEKKAMEFREKKEIVGKKGNWFTLSAVLFQIAIMLSSVSALLHRKSMWIVGLFFGFFAIIFFANGFFLFFSFEKWFHA